MKNGFKLIKKIAGAIFTLCFLLIFSASVDAVSINIDTTPLQMTKLGDKKQVVVRVSGITPAEYDSIDITIPNSSGTPTFIASNKRISWDSSNAFNVAVDIESVNKKGTSFTLNVKVNLKTSEKVNPVKQAISVNWDSNGGDPDTPPTGSGIYYSGSNILTINQGSYTEIKFYYKPDSGVTYKNNSATFELINSPSYSITKGTETLKSGVNVLTCKVKGETGYSNNPQFTIKVSVDYSRPGASLLTLSKSFDFQNKNTDGVLEGNDLTFNFAENSLTFKNEKATVSTSVEIGGFSNTVVYERAEYKALMPGSDKKTSSFNVVEKSSKANATDLTKRDNVFNVKNVTAADTCVVEITVYYTKDGVKYYQKAKNVYKTDLTGSCVEAPESEDGDASGVYGDPDTLFSLFRITDDDETATSLGGVIYDFAKVIAAILTFACVIMVGINIIQAKGKGEERSSAMTGLMYITIGVIILDCAVLIFSLLNGLAGDPVEDLDSIEYVTEE